MSKTAKLLIAAGVLLLLSGSTYGIEAKEVKRACDRAGNWLIEQFDLKEKVFGKGPEAKDVTTVAMVVTALCNHPRDYKESSGPFVGEPVKYILSQINEDGTLKPHEYDHERQGWISQALRVTGNEKYRVLAEKCAGDRPARTGPPTPSRDPVAVTELTVASLEAHQWRAGILLRKGTREVVVDGKTVKWGEVMAESLLKLQQKNGSFGDDIQVNALALNILNVCYRVMK